MVTRSLARVKIELYFQARMKCYDVKILWGFFLVFFLILSYSTVSYILGQDILGTPERWQKVIALIPDEQLRNKLDKDFANLKNSEQRWSKLVKMTNEINQDEIMLQYSYPRLDINVSKGLNHLLKSPFCIHPKTGRVCIPFDPSKVDDFKPENVPTVNQLVNELDKFAKEEKENSGIVKDYNKTSLKGPMKIFETFLKGLLEQ